MRAFVSLTLCALGAVVGTGGAQGLPAFCTPALAPIPVLSTPGLTLIQAQVVINNADRLQTDLGTCWATINETSYSCTLISLSTPWAQSSDQTLEVGRLYRMNAVAGEEAVEGSCFAGQLTLEGYTQHRTNGANMQVYVGPDMLLAPLLSAMPQGSVYLRTSSDAGSVMSAQAFFMGLYSPISSTGGLEIIDMFTADPQTEYIVPNMGHNPRLQSIMDNVTASDEYLAHYKTVTAPLLLLLANATGLPEQSVFIPAIKECVTSSVCHGYPVPAGLEDPNVLSALYNEELFMWQLLANSSTFFPCASATFLGMLMDRVTETVGHATNGIPFALYSAPTQGALAFLLTALGIVPTEMPPPASVAVFEVYSNVNATSNATATVVRLVYNGAVLPIPNCSIGYEPDGLCAWSVVQANIQTFLDACPASAPAPAMRAQTMFGSAPRPASSNPWRDSTGDRR